MPFIRTAIPDTFPDEKRAAIVQGIHEALVSSIGMPPDELFNLVTPYAPGQFFYDRTFNGVSRSASLVVVEITMRRGRSDAMKKALYERIAQNLKEGAQVPTGDVFIFTHENDYSDWSVGHGKMAMSLVQQCGADV